MLHLACRQIWRSSTSVTLRLSHTTQTRALLHHGLFCDPDRRARNTFVIICRCLLFGMLTLASLVLQIPPLHRQLPDLR